MDARLRQRLIGALVLTAVAIVILPILLDGTAEDRQQVVARIPDAPDVSVTRISVSEVREKMKAMERASAAQMPLEVEDKQEYEQDFTLDQNSLPVSWSLQVGSFEKEDNATSLRKKLRDANYTSYIIHARTSEANVYRVFVGPMLSKSELVSIAADIESSFDLKGDIVRYQVEEDAGQLGG